MSDIALLLDAEAFAFDIHVVDGSLAVDDGLKTAIALSLFTDARARADDALPTADADPRGWWGNAFPQEDALADDELGSRLWLLERSKTTADVVARARTYAAEALAWLVQDGIARSVEVETERQGDRIAIGVMILRPGENQPTRYDFLWEGSL